MNSWLTPNQQLLVFLVGMLVTNSIIVVAYLLIQREITRRLGAVRGLWEVALSAAQAILTHPHAFAKPLDEALKSNMIDLSVPLSPELKRLLIERSLSNDPSLRENEIDAALAYPFLRKMAAQEAASELPLTHIEMVGSHEPSNQKADESH